MAFKYDVVIPTYKPDERLRELLRMLMIQKERPEQILIVNTEKEFFDQGLTEGIEGLYTGGGQGEGRGPQEVVFNVMHIRKMDFDHGGTRHMAASLLQNDLILFMTQDAIPANEHLTENLIRLFEDDRVCASYARQIPGPKCGEIEKCSRNFNYPAESIIKTADDLPSLGIKTFFCSNVCAMYRRSSYEELGGFERRTIFNEDMIFAFKLINAGKAVAYCAEAEVIHFHNYNGREQFARNFDLGVSQAEHPEVFSGISSAGEGLSMVRRTAAYLTGIGKPWLLPVLVWQSGCKYLGYLLGKNYRHIPEALVRACSLNKDYWR